MAKTENINLQVVGDDITLVLTVKINDVVTDVSGSTSSFTIRDSYGGSILSQSAGTFVTDGTDGQIEFNAPSTSTTNATADTDYVYDIGITLASGRKYTLKRGLVRFVADV